MTALRESAIAELEKVLEEKLGIVIQFISKVMREDKTRKQVWNLDQFVMPPTERTQNTDIYVRELKNNDRL